jgi:DNA topoisomerase-2
LNPLSRLLFPEADDAVLTYLDDDGLLVEPEYYVPILPFCLVNGVSGIGTGFSTDIPSYSPVLLSKHLQAKLRGMQSQIEFVPYYEGFKGEVIKVADDKYSIRGKYERVGEDKIRIVELPVGTWTMPYLAYLDELLEGGADKEGKKVAPVLKDVVNLSTEVVVDITVQFPKGRLASMSTEALEKLLKMTTTVSTTNMHLFDAERKLHKYATIEEIIDAFYIIRLETYHKRKAALVAAMRALLVRLSNRARYILEVLSGKVDLRKKTNQQVVEMLEGFRYDKIDGDYKYLIKMPMDSVTEEHVAKIVQEKADTETELETLLKTTVEEIWLRELEQLDREMAAKPKKVASKK